MNTLIMLSQNAVHLSSPIYTFVFSLSSQTLPIRIIFSPEKLVTTPPQSYLGPHPELPSIILPLDISKQRPSLLDICS